MAESSNTLPSPPNVANEITEKDKSLNQLKDLTAKATAKYSIKDYDAAAEIYAEAVELQADINGEMSPENADLLYAYGRCLYHVAVRSSDVLGTKVAGEKRASKPRRSADPKSRESNLSDTLAGQDQRIAEEVAIRLVEEKEGQMPMDEETEKERKQYFQFIGDENWDSSDDEVEDVAEGGDDREAGDDGEEEDDFSNAYEVLDMARVLLQKKIAESDTAIGKDKGKGESLYLRQLKERLSDTHDLEAEILLEGEKFPLAVADLKSALKLKTELYPQESSLIAEAHFKLSLALEFSSVTQQKAEDGEPAPDTDAHIDETMREEAASEMEAAIASCKLRIKKEEAKLAAELPMNRDSGKPQVTQADIDDVREMIKDMEQRLIELRQPPVSINDPKSTGTVDGSSPLHGILGKILGETPEAHKKRIEQASKGANDLSNLVKKKKSAPHDDSTKVTNVEGLQTNGKRKTEALEESNCSKRAKVEDGEEE